ncbi:hypothetical protein JCM10207_005556 [Rhodosporidiobolus poonsookiae]
MADTVHPVGGDGPIFVRALYDYQGADASSLSFRQGEILEILSTLESGWWDGVALSSGTRGWLPSNFVAQVSEEEAQLATLGGDSRRGSVATLNDAGGAVAGAGVDAFSSGMVQDFAALGLTRDATFADFMTAANDDLTSFSTGGDIFSEIAAAAQAESSGLSGSASQPHASTSTSPHAVPSHSASTPAFGDLAAAVASFGGALDPDAVDDAADDEEDFWVPKMTKSGQLFYLNTRTGETSRDMPIDGQGDGVRVDPSEFEDPDDALLAAGATLATASASGAVEPAPGEPGSEWSERTTADGTGVYYVNLRTGEQAWDPPVPSSRRGSLARGTGAAGAPGDPASLLSAWTERAGGAVGPSPLDVARAEQQGEEALRRASFGSDDSALDMAFAGSARRERRGSGGEGAKPPVEVEKVKEEKKRATPRRKATALTAELLGPPPPPLLTDLEEIATRALQELINAVGLGGVARTAQRDFAAERARLARLGDDVVHAVRLVLHSSGVLEHSVISSPFAATSSPVNEITGPFHYSAPLPPSAQSELRPFSRRLISTLSKLTFSLRAMWGLLETTVEDQVVPEDDSPADPDEVLRRAQARQQALAERRAVREARFEHETKLRSEIMQGTRDVNDQVLTFLSQFQRVALASLVASGAGTGDLSQLRAPKPLQGSLRTYAGALLLPGGGFGGNWRGNGFVSLPTPHASPAVPQGPPGATDGRTLSYAWPGKAISKEVVDELRKVSDALVGEAEQLQAAAQDGTPLEALLTRATAAQDQLATFLAEVEDVDVAAGVDFQLPRGEESRPSSRPASTSTGASETDESVPAKAYKASVREAKPLLAEFEARKQALYDVAPRLLVAVQNALESAVATPAEAGQPVSNSPLASSPPPSTASSTPDLSSLRVIAADLATAGPSLCTTLSSLAAVAEVQASAPRDLRTHSLAFRSTLFDHAATASSSAATSEVGHGGTAAARMSATRSSQSHDSTIRSSVRSSADSDFFFSGALPNAGRGLPHSSGAASSSTSLSLTGGSGSGGHGTVRSQSSAGGGGARPPLPFGTASTGPPSASGSVEVLSGLPPGWDGRRRASVATSQTSSSAGTAAATPSLGSVQEGQGFSTLSPTRNSHKNIQKLLGEVPVDASAAGRAWYLDRDWGDEELSFTMENTVKGGTLRGLVIAATSHEGRVDSSYLSAFLMTYRTFCSSPQLLDELIDRYLVHEPEGLSSDEYKDWELKKLRPVRARVTNLIKAWVREYMDHEDLDPVLLSRIREFALNTMTEKGQSLQICKSVDERLQGAAPRAIGNLAPGALPTPIVPRNLKKFKLTDLEPLELARQLTIMDSRLFQRITPQECLSKAWPKEFGSEAPNISAMIDMSNAVTRWVTETILAQEDLKKRANIVKHFISVAERCLALNNFSTLIHIIAGLNSTPIHRLRRTWETVNQKAMISLGMLNNVMRPDKNYKEYRDILRRAAPPCVPFLGVYLTDWTFIGDGNPDQLREKPHQINFHKRSKASELILQIKLHQATSYNLAQQPQIAKWLQEQLFPAQVHEDQEGHLYNISLALEPRERDDEKIARLLSESGFL